MNESAPRPAEEAPEVVATLEDDTGAHCVDIVRHAEGDFGFIEYARDAEDPDAWHPRTDVPAKSYPSQYAAYAAATREIDWLMA